MFELLQEAVHNLVTGAAGTVLGWLGRLLRAALLAFVVGGALATAAGVGVVFENSQKAPTQTSWLIIGAIALNVALVSLMGTVLVVIARSLVRLVRHPPSLTMLDPRSPDAGNVRQLPVRRDKRRNLG